MEQNPDDTRREGIRCPHCGNRAEEKDDHHRGCPMRDVSDEAIEDTVNETLEELEAEGLIRTGPR